MMRTARYRSAELFLEARAPCAHTHDTEGGLQRRAEPSTRITKGKLTGRHFSEWASGEEQGTVSKGPERVMLWKCA